MSDKLKVAIGTDAFPPTIDGISKVAENYAKYINKNHGEAVIITPNCPNAEDWKYDYEIYRYKSFSFSKKDEYMVGWPFKEQFRLDLRAKNFDILHSHCPLASSYFFRLVCEEQNVPTVATYHTKYEYDIETRVPTKPFQDFAKRFITNNLNAADEVWVTSAGTEESLRRIGYKGDFIVMPNGVDLSKGKSSEAAIGNLRAKYKLRSDVPTLLYVGRMMWYKNIKIIIDAAAILKSQGRDFQILMLGIGPEEGQIRRYIRQKGLTRSFIFTGKILDREQLKAFYSASDLLLFPSTFDTNGLVVREAAACSLPAVLTRNSCAAEGISDFKTGFLASENAHDFALRVGLVMDNKELISKVGANAANEIYISWEDSVANAYNRYQTVIENYNKKLKNR